MDVKWVDTSPKPTLHEDEEILEYFDKAGAFLARSEDGNSLMDDPLEVDIEFPLLGDCDNGPRFRFNIGKLIQEEIDASVGGDESEGKTLFPGFRPAATKLAARLREIANELERVLKYKDEADE